MVQEQLEEAAVFGKETTSSLQPRSSFKAICATCEEAFDDFAPPQPGVRRFCDKCRTEWRQSRRVMSCFSCRNRVEIHFEPRDGQPILCRACTEDEAACRNSMLHATGDKRKFICEGCGEEKHIPFNWKIDPRRPLYCQSCYPVSRSTTEILEKNADNGDETILHMLDEKLAVFEREARRRAIKNSDSRIWE